MRDKTKHPADMSIITLRNYWFNMGTLSIPNMWFPIDTSEYTGKPIAAKRVWDSRPI